MYILVLSHKIYSTLLLEHIPPYEIFGIFHQSRIQQEFTSSEIFKDHEKTKGMFSHYYFFFLFLMIFVDDDVLMIWFDSTTV